MAGLRTLWSNMNRLQTVFPVIWIEFLVVFSLAMIIRAINLSHDPIHDELYHLLAARSWVDDGSLAISDGVYTRATLYTMFVGVVYDIFGQSLDAVRLSSVVTGSLWAAALHLWVRKHLGLTVALFATFLFCFAPGAIFLSQYVRFYALHGLLFFLGAITIYSIAETSRLTVGSIFLVILAILLLLTAAHLQITTFIGLVGVFAWVVFRMTPKVWQKLSAVPKRRNAYVAGTAIILVVSLITLLGTGILQGLFYEYRAAANWSASGPLIYHWMFLGQFPLIWASIPLATLIAISRQSAPATFCCIVFSTSILLHSFAGMKAERFIYYAMPFFFVSGSYLARELLSYVADACERWWITRLQPLKYAAIFVTILPFILSNAALRTTADMLRARPAQTLEGNLAYWSAYPSNWTIATEIIGPLAEEASVVVTSQGLHMIYFIGDYDIELLKSASDTVGEEFAIDPRMGRPTISTGESFELVRSCFENGLVVIHDFAWRNQYFVPDDAADAIENSTDRLDVPSSVSLKVFRWQGTSLPVPDDCPRLRGISAG